MMRPNLKQTSFQVPTLSFFNELSNTEHFMRIHVRRKYNGFMSPNSRFLSQKMDSDQKEDSVLGHHKIDANGFPYLREPAKEMMNELVDILDKNLGNEVKRTTTPENIRNFKSSVSKGEGYINTIAGKDRSKLDRVLVTWIHSETPIMPIDSAALSIQAGSDVDFPHLLMEFMFMGSSKLVATMDLIPRKDLALNFDYLENYYEKTSLLSLLKQCENEALLKPYVISNMKISSLLSPTALVYTSDAVNGNVDDVVRHVFHPIAVEVLNTWISNMKKCVKHKNADVSQLLERDRVFRQVVEEDIRKSLTPLFGKDVTSNVLKIFRMEL